MVFIPHPQWPGYHEWKRQFQTRDETPNRNPITFEKFVRHIGRSVDKFMSVSTASFCLPFEAVIDRGPGSCFGSTSG
jgi:hypothetical protein